MTKLSDEAAIETVNAVLKHGSIKGAAEALGLSRISVRKRMDNARQRGLTDIPKNPSIPSRWRPVDEIIAARKGEFERVKAAGDGRTLHTVHMPDDGPYCLIALGDPHLDSPGTDLRLWEHWIGFLDQSKRIYALGLGDWLDNWVKPLAFLYAQSETPAPEGWILLEHYLDRIAPHMLASCSGNHDDWSGASDLLGKLMADRDVLHRAVSLRVALRSRGGAEITVGIRHRFSGSSQWNTAHAVVKAAKMGWRDTLLIGGDKHISGDGLVKCPDTGKLTFCYQVAAFKIMDDYGDVLGLADKHVSPAVAFVVDPSRAPHDPQIVTPFHDPAAAVDYLTHLRKRWKKGA